jgi:hypothetical protein
MIRLAEVAAAFLPQLEAQYSERLLPGHRHALSAILHCRTEQSGTAAIHCHECEHDDSFPLSCVSGVNYLVRSVTIILSG